VVVLLREHASMTEQDPDTGSDKMSISFPRGTRDELKALVESGTAPSVSAFVAEAVTERLRRERFDRKIGALMRSGPLPDEAIDWACQSLGATPEQTVAMHARFGAPGGQESVTS
jgi:Arc/MetJ-type ribon-helix-helix transcriptional regulator